VVPFSPAAGLLEWVEETIPLSEYLNGADRASGAHARYARPGDFTFLAAFEHIHKATKADPGRASLRRAYDEVCPEAVARLFMHSPARLCLTCRMAGSCTLVLLKSACHLMSW
jgi:hypothetical protein